MPAIAPRSMLEEDGYLREYPAGPTNVGPQRRKLWAGRSGQVKNRLSMPLSEIPMASLALVVSKHCDTTISAFAVIVLASSPLAGEGCTVFSAHSDG